MFRSLSFKGFRKREIDAKDNLAATQDFLVDILRSIARSGTPFSPRVNATQRCPALALRESMPARQNWRPTSYQVTQSSIPFFFFFCIYSRRSAGRVHLTTNRISLYGSVPFFSSSLFLAVTLIQSPSRTLENTHLHLLYKMLLLLLTAHHSTHVCWSHLCWWLNA